MPQTSLKYDVKSNKEPVECLGLTFENDEKRREFFLQKLRDMLKDPEFRKIEGFPIGTDEDILALSDPPYYTACPNPFIEDFIHKSGVQYDSSKPYHREPFASDVSEGKYDPIYKYHPYPTKVPHMAIMRYILHYTEPGDFVFDGFCGTGMTGVAAQMCGDRNAVTALGYRVEKDGTILSSEEDDASGKNAWKPFSKLGVRSAVLNDLSPAATFISYNYNSEINLVDYERKVKEIFKKVESECSWMYETKHPDGRVGRINYTVWSDVFICQECSGEVVFWDNAVEKSEGKVKDEFNCIHCSALITKRSLERAWISTFDGAIGETIRQAKQVPVIINYSIGTGRYEKKPDKSDLELIDKIENTKMKYWYPSNRMIDGKETRRNDPIGLTHEHHFYFRRNLITLSALRSQCDSPKLLLLITKVAFQITKLYRFTYQSGVWGAGGGPLSGTLYVPSLIKELNIIKQLNDALKNRIKASPKFTNGSYIGSTQSSSTLVSIPSSSMDYIFLDPPFGSNLYYSELASLWEAWLKVSTNNLEEAIENDSQGKGLNEYRHLMTRCFKDAYRVLKPGRWMTIEFSNTKASVWNSIQTALSEAGFIVANVSALDKQKGSFKAVTTPTAVKQDLVISAYKPNGGLEARFQINAGTEAGIWDFVRSHLKYLPVTKPKKEGLEHITERDPRIIYDRMVSWYVQHVLPVPLSSQEFQAGLMQRFAERDGMIFLPEQVAEYDKKRLVSNQLEQQSLFVSDERTAIDWLQNFLKVKPCTYQDVLPDFMPKLNEAAWKKHETRPELSLLLEQNFLRCDGKSEVPSQIHSYLSTNFKDLRNLPKDSPLLKSKAKDRWYVPDPNKAQDLEKIRDKALMKEFEEYRAFSGRKLKTFRLEAIRAGFRKAWGDKDYPTIITVAQKVPEDVLQEDPKLTMWYDGAMTRMGD